MPKARKIAPHGLLLSIPERIVLRTHFDLEDGFKKGQNVVPIKKKLKKMIASGDYSERQVGFMESIVGRLDGTIPNRESSRSRRTLTEYLDSKKPSKSSKKTSKRSTKSKSKVKAKAKTRSTKSTKRTRRVVKKSRSGKKSRK